MNHRLSLAEVQRRRSTRENDIGNVVIERAVSLHRALKPGLLETVYGVGLCPVEWCDSWVAALPAQPASGADDWPAEVPLEIDTDDVQARFLLAFFAVDDQVCCRAPGGGSGRHRPRRRGQRRSLLLHGSGHDRQRGPEYHRPQRPSRAPLVHILETGRHLVLATASRPKPCHRGSDPPSGPVPVWSPQSQGRGRTGTQTAAAAAAVAAVGVDARRRSVEDQGAGLRTGIDTGAAQQAAVRHAAAGIDQGHLG